jgi:hypothetical protein
VCQITSASYENTVDKSACARALAAGRIRRSQSAIGYRIMVWSAGYRIAGTLVRRARCHIKQEKT